MIAYWLMPRASEAVPLRALVERLSQVYDAPLFEPHLTVYTEETDDPEDAERVIDTLGRSEAIRLAVCGVEHSGQLTKTVFIQFESSPALEVLFDTAQRTARHPSGYQINPHLSLIYKRMAADERERLARSVEIPCAEVVFDRAAAIRIPRPIRTEEDISGWDVICGRALTQERASQGNPDHL